MDSEQRLRIVERGESEDKPRNAQCRDDADRNAVAREHAGESARPGIGGPGFGAQNGKWLGHIDVEFVRRRELTVGIAGTASVAESGQIIEVASVERAPP